MESAYSRTFAVAAMATLGFAVFWLGRVLLVAPVPTEVERLGDERPRERNARPRPTGSSSYTSHAADPRPFEAPVSPATDTVANRSRAAKTRSALPRTARRTDGRRGEPPRPRAARPAKRARITLRNRRARQRGVPIDASIRRYVAKPELRGSLVLGGSPSVHSLVAAWAEQFREIYRLVKIEVLETETKTAIAKFLDGSSNALPLGRALTKQEIDRFTKRAGYAPTRIAVAMDAIGVFVHSDNPIQKLRLRELDAIFSKSRKGGYPGAITTWGQLGLVGEWQNAAIELIGHETDGVFRRIAAFDGELKGEVKKEAGGTEVKIAVAGNRTAIGFARMGFSPVGDVRSLRLARGLGRYVAATRREVYDGKYPLTRPLVFYVDRSSRRLAPVLEEFLRFALSRDGQRRAVRQGFLHVCPSSVARALRRL